MGASQKKEAVEQFVAWAGSSGEPDEEQFVSKVSLYSAEITSGIELFSAARPVAESLVENSKYNHRIHWLLKYVAGQVKSMTDDNSAGTLPQIAMIWSVELVLRHILRIVGGHSQDLLQFMENSSSPSGDGGASLCKHLVEYLITVKLNTLTVLTHLSVVRLLITMTSSALHHNTVFDETKIDVFTELLLSSKRIDQLVMVLLRRLVRWGTGETPAEPSLHSSEKSAPTFFNLFGLLGRSSAPSEEVVPAKGNAPVYVYPSSRAFDMVGRLSSQLLCILLVHQKSNGKNTALNSLCQLQHNEPISYSTLLQAISAKLIVCPTLGVLLYALFYDHPSFLNYITQSDVGALMVACQQIIHLLYRVGQETETGGRGASYHTSSSKGATGSIVPVDEDPSDIKVLENVIHDMLLFAYPFENFLFSTLLFIVSQDQLTNSILCDTIVSVDFSSEKTQEKCFLGALALRILTLNVSRAFSDGNESLCNVLIPCMINLSLFVHDMDRASALRLVSLLCLLIKKIRKLGQVVGGGEDGEGEEEEANAETQTLLTAEMYLRQIAMVVEVVDNLIRDDNEHHNEHLIYELLYHRGKIIDALNKGVVGEVEEKTRRILSGLTTSIINYEALIEEAHLTSTADILKLLHTRQAANEIEMSEIKPREERELAYTYEEIANSYIFFGPFVWSTLLSSARRPGGILFGLSPLEFNIFPHGGYDGA